VVPACHAARACDYHELVGVPCGVWWHRSAPPCTNLLGMRRRLWLPLAWEDATDDRLFCTELTTIPHYLPPGWRSEYPSSMVIVRSAICSACRPRTSPCLAQRQPQFRRQPDTERARGDGSCITCPGCSASSRNNTNTCHGWSRECGVQVKCSAWSSRPLAWDETWLHVVVRAGWNVRSITVHQRQSVTEVTMELQQLI
jgi:hypothetical protein